MLLGDDVIDFVRKVHELLRYLAVLTTSMITLPDEIAEVLLHAWLGTISDIFQGSPGLRLEQRQEIFHSLVTVDQGFLIQC